MYWKVHLITFSEHQNAKVITPAIKYERFIFYSVWLWEPHIIITPPASNTCHKWHAHKEAWCLEPSLAPTPRSLTTPYTYWFREEAQVRPCSPPNPYLPSKEEAKAIPCSPLLTILTNIPPVKHNYMIPTVYKGRNDHSCGHNAHNVYHKYSTKGLTCEKSHRHNRDYSTSKGDR